MAGRHHSRCPIEHGSEELVVAQFGFARGDAHPHRQLHRPLRGHRGIDGRTR